MKEDIIQRINEIKEHKIPNGYIKSKIGILPAGWDVVPFNKKFSRLNRKNDEDNQNVLTISAKQGLISQQDYYTTLYASENKKGYSLLYKGNFVYNKSYSSEYLYGAIKKLDKYTKGIVSPLYICFEPKKGTNSEYYSQYFEFGIFNYELYKIAQEGARNHGLLNISITDFFDTYLIDPPVKEQEKIAEILAYCDKIIELQENLINDFLKMKKVLLQKMFPKKDENIPEVRFPGFTDDWEQCELGDIMEITSVKRIHKSDWTDSGVRFLRARDIVAVYKNEKVHEPLFISQEKYDEYSALSGKVKIGDLLVTGVGTIGVPMLINSREPLYFKDGNIIWFKNENRINGRFFYYSFNGSLIQNFITESSGTGTVGTYTIENGKKTPIYLPIQKDEQEKIGAYFSHLDHLITLHQRKLQLWQQKKKSLMQLLLTGIVRVKI